MVTLFTFHKLFNDFQNSSFQGNLESSLIEKIAQLVKDKVIDGITDLRDESNRQGLKLVIEIRRDFIKTQNFSERVMPN